MQGNTKQIVPEEETIAKYTIKDSVFSDVFKIRLITLLDELWEYAENERYSNGESGRASIRSNGYRNRR